MIYACCDNLRRIQLERSKELNGIDFVEVLPSQGQNGASRRHTLHLHFINAHQLSSLTRHNIRLEGGERTTFSVISIGLPTAASAESQSSCILCIQVEGTADFSKHVLRLVKTSGEPGDSGVPAGFDPALSMVGLRFHTPTVSEFDCRPQAISPPDRRDQPVINYLAKDYASFRALLLERLRLSIPDWEERHAADLGVTLVELLAYVGDYLSYQQDAVATEAYLGTARRRVSVRRHARLVDYRIHDGCNARAWVAIEVAGDLNLQEGTQLFTRLEGEPAREDALKPVFLRGSPEHKQALAQKALVFETMHTANLREAHNELHFYAWGDERCCLPVGAIRATLKADSTDSKSRPDLKTGDVLIFEELCDPETGFSYDSDMRRCHAVRLTEVKATGQSGRPLLDPLYGQPIVEIGWGREDALPFPLCISSRTDRAHGERYIEKVSVARGNIVLADHGCTIGHFALGETESLGPAFLSLQQDRIEDPEKLRDGAHDAVPALTMFRVHPPEADPCRRTEPAPVMPRFRPALQRGPLTWASLYRSEASAAALTHVHPHDALPQIKVRSSWQAREAIWSARHDLLGSDPEDAHFVVETESDGTAFLRFGDDNHGISPGPGTEFWASYRIGNGTSGNVGLEAIAHLVPGENNLEGQPYLPERIIRIRNPLPARGGAEPETLQEARAKIPEHFREQKRAVAEADYARMAEVCMPGEIQQAVAKFRWTGSWHTPFLTVDRFGGISLDNTFKYSLCDTMDHYRMAGCDLKIEGARYVALEVEIDVHVMADHFRGDVEESLLELLSNRDLPDGTRGLFHPDNFRFGQPVHLGPVYAKALEVDGVDYVLIRKFQKLNGNPEAQELREIEMRPLEIARLDNDPDFPDRGILRLNMIGGK